MNSLLQTASTVSIPDSSLFDKSDEEILEMSLQNPAVFEILVDRYQERFIKKAREILKTQEDAEDAVQETMVRIYRYGHTFQRQKHATFASWAYKILFNTSFTLYQKKKKKFEHNPSLDHEICDLVADGTVEFDQAVVHHDTYTILNRMPGMLRSVLEKHFLWGKSQKEIAQEEGVPVGTIKARVHRAKKEFRKISSKAS